MPYLIDGHNLIAALPGISLDDPNDEAKLVARLRQFAAGRGKTCTVVFDGGLPGGHSPMSTKAVTVIFAASQHASADSLILRRIRRTTDAGAWTVVSSDREIRSCARHRGMKHLASGEFAQLMRAPAREQERRGEEAHPTISADELNEWLAIFDGGGEAPE